MMAKNKSHNWICLGIAFFLLVLAIPQLSVAIEPEQARPSSCTGKNISQGGLTTNKSGPGSETFSNILGQVETKIVSTMDKGASHFYKTMVANYRPAFTLVLTLFVVIYGVAFMFGFVQVSGADFLIRLAKVAVIIALIGPAGWEIFYNTAGKLFIEGTNSLISEVTNSANNSLYNGPRANPNPEAPPGAQAGVSSVAKIDTGESTSPLNVLNASLLLVFSVKMGLAIIALVFSSFFGFAIAIFLCMGIYYFLKAFLSAIWVYMMSIIVRAVLFALAPFFIIFLLFEKTRYLFDGWVSQLISYSLQPIFLFFFLGFYTVLIDNALTSILTVDICWLPEQFGPPEALFEFIRFAINQKDWFDQVSNFAQANVPSSRFPIDILDVLMFTLTSYVAWGATGLSVQIAEDLSSGLDLSEIRGSLESYTSDLTTMGKGAAVDWAFGRFGR